MGLVQRLPAFAATDPGVQRDAVVAAWLHDVIEDTDVTAADLLARGLPHRAVEAVMALTRTPHVAPEDYYATVTTLPVAHLVKAADVASNLEPSRVAQLGVARSVIDELHA